MKESERKYDLAPLWEAILEVYKEFDRICQKYRLRHFAIGGTIIGAVRHQGFIPWDDDLDLAIPVEDFERFCDVAKHELPHYLKLVTWQNTKGYENLFAKIVDLRHDKLSELRNATNLPIGQGVFIDLFLLTGVPVGVKYFTEILFPTWVLSLRKSYSTFGFRWSSPIVIIKSFLGCIVSGCKRRQMSDNAYAEQRWAIAGRFKCAGSKRVGVYYGMSNLAYFFVVPTISFAASVRVPFRDTTMPLCVGFDEVVRAEYPDYLELPPPEKRILLHVKQSDAPWFDRNNDK